MTTQLAPGGRPAVGRDDARTALLGGLFDDAAVFPPATRPLEDALASHRGHQSSERRWLVRRFLVRASTAPDLLAALDADDVLDVGVVLDLTTDASFADAVEADLRRVVEVSRDPRVQLTGVELALPCEDADAEVGAVQRALRVVGVEEDVSVALEVPVARTPAGRVVAGLGAIAAARNRGGPGSSRLAAKLRCGGTVASATPTDLEVAGFLLATARMDLPFKATAGLHHPTRTVSYLHGGTDHGFLNLALAAAASRAQVDLDGLVTRISLPGDVFSLTAVGLVAGAEAVDGPTLLDLRRRCLLGIGCCDILDPIADLAGMGTVLPTGGLR